VKGFDNKKIAGLREMIKAKLESSPNMTLDEILGSSSRNRFCATDPDSSRSENSKRKYLQDSLAKSAFKLNEYPTMNCQVCPRKTEILAGN
jgi:hypothetical protein